MILGDWGKIFWPNLIDDALVFFKFDRQID